MTSSTSATPAIIPPDRLPPIESHGFGGGRDDLHAFCARVFTQPSPRFFRDADGHLVVYRNRDLQALGSAPEVGAVPPQSLFGPIPRPAAHSAPPPGMALAWTISNQIFTTNPPVHKPVRRLLSGEMGPRQARDMEHTAQTVAEDVLDTLAPIVTAGQEIDVARNLANRMVCGFWGRLLGLLPDEIEAIARHVHDMTPMFFLNHQPEDLARLERGAAGYRQILADAAARTLAYGGNPLIERLAQGLASIDQQGDLDETGIVPTDVGMLLAGNLVDGFHTAAVAVANCMHVMANRPEVMPALQARPDAIGQAVFEALRLEPPVIMLKRRLLADLTYQGIALRKGAILTMMWGAGGLDPDVFPEPGQFDLGRSLQGSTTFGGGTHLCIGRSVAPMIVRTLLKAMIARSWRIVPGDSPTNWIGGHVMCQTETFSARIVPMAPGEVNA